MTTRSPRLLALFVCAFALLPRAASAQPYPQDRTFSPQLFHPAVGPDEFFTVEPARPLEHLNFSLGLWLNYSNGMFSAIQVNYDKDGNARLGDKLADIIKDNLSADAVFAIGLYERLQLGIGIPVVLVQTFDPQINFPNGNSYVAGSPTSFALGDPWIDAKVRLYGKTLGPSLALAGRLYLPLSQATADSFGGDSNVMASARALGSWEGERWRAGLMLGFLYRAHDSQYFSTSIGNQVLYGAAFGIDVAAKRAATLVAELHGHNDISNSKSNTINANPLEIDLGVKFKLARSVTGTVGVGTGFIAGLGAPLFRGFLGVSWAPDNRDRDKDGVPDLEDKCPDEPEDRDGFRDDDGCPDPDNDGDGLPDARDKCPNDPEDFDGFQDDDGCPEPDNDGDGLPDIRDACPMEKEDGRPPRTQDGCPFDKTDSDEDGVPDNKDKCPLEQEDKDGFQDDDGCIDPDNDGDGILDGRDRCPNEPETINGFQDEDGCPDRGPPMKVQVVGDEIVLLDKVNFKTAKAIIEPRSYYLLDQAHSILRLHPEITLVLIEGHTDGKGNPAKNLKLSQDRADAVKAYLVRKGIAAARLAAKGFGATRPVADNKTERGREANRRVQFKILEQKKK